MPISNENRVRVEFLSKMTATPRGPSSGRRLNGFVFSSAASASTSACSSGVRSSSRRKCRVMTSAALSSTSGQRGQEVVDLALGDDQRWGQPNHIGRGGVDEEPGASGCRFDGLGRFGGEHDTAAAVRGRGHGRQVDAPATRCRPKASCRGHRRGRSDRRRPVPAAPPALRPCRQGCRRTCCRAGRGSADPPSCLSRGTHRSAARRPAPWPA